MPNAIYPLYKQSLLDGDANIDLNDLTVRVALVDTGAYTYNPAHQFLTSLSGVVGTAQIIANTTVADGIFNGDDVTFNGVTGNNAEALVIYIDTTVAATSRLVAFIDSNVTGLPVTPNGGNITVTWNASGIFQL